MVKDKPCCRTRQPCEEKVHITKNHTERAADEEEQRGDESKKGEKISVNYQLTSLQR